MSETSDRILDAAWALMHQGGVAAVTLADIAAEAGVSRQAVYLHFENRAGLLVAMARRRDVSSGLMDRLQSLRSKQPEDALQGLLEAWFDYVPDILPIARALEAASITGAEGAEAWRDRMDALRATIGEAVLALEAAGKLSREWDASRAADWVYTRASIGTWDALKGLGWTPEEIKARAVASIMAEVRRS